MMHDETKLFRPDADSPSSNTLHGADGSNVTIALVDPDQTTSEMIVRSLQISNGNLVVFSSGASFLRSFFQRIRNNLYDLCVIELDLPDIDGLSVLKQIRNHTDVPAIIYSRRGDVSSAVEVMRYPFTDYIEKPGIEILIRNKTKELLEQYRLGS